MSCSNEIVETWETTQGQERRLEGRQKGRRVPAKENGSCPGIRKEMEGKTEDQVERLA